MTKAFVRAKLPGCDHYVVTTFFEPPIRSKFREGHDARPAHPARADPRRQEEAPDAGDHVLVYQTSTSDTKLLDELERVREREVHRLRPAQERAAAATAPSRSSARTGFVDDLATARAVVCNGGLSLIGEALYLGKPIFSVPVRNQYEQVLNARYLEQLGYGLEAPRRSTPTSCGSSSPRRRSTRRGSAKHKQDGNRELFDVVDRVLDRFARKSRRARANDREAET